MCLDYIRELRLKIADKWIKGDKSESQAIVVLELHQEIDRDIRKVPQRYADFAMRVAGSWGDEVMTYGRFGNMPLEEMYLILTFLLGQDLFAYGIKKVDKLKWIESYSLSDADLVNLDVNTLWTYMTFNQSAIRLNEASIEEEDEQYPPPFGIENSITSKGKSIYPQCNRIGTCQV